MKALKIRSAAPTAEHLCFAILSWYLAGSIAFLIFLVLLSWLIG